MALLLPRAVSQRFRQTFSQRFRQTFQTAGRQLREVTQVRLGRAPEPPSGAPPHVYNHLHKTGEMNHPGPCRCDVCDAPMGLAAASAGVQASYRWECPDCGACDDTSFRFCRCGRQSVLEKHAAGVRLLPVSLSAGGCTDCERCVLCDGVLSLGNLRWFYGRWTYLYPDTELDRRTLKEYAVTRERSKFYGFHCHASCHDKDPEAARRHLAALAPDWYAQGEAKQRAAEDARLKSEGRCPACRRRLSLLSRLLGRDRHARCASQG